MAMNLTPHFRNVSAPTLGEKTSPMIFRFPKPHVTWVREAQSRRGKGITVPLRRNRWDRLHWVSMCWHRLDALHCRRSIIQCSWRSECHCEAGPRMWRWGRPPAEPVSSFRSTYFSLYSPVFLCISHCVSVTRYYPVSCIFPCFTFLLPLSQLIRSFRLSTPHRLSLPPVSLPSLTHPFSLLLFLTSPLHHPCFSHSLP
jgi:hypothetical protein